MKIRAMKIRAMKIRVSLTNLSLMFVLSTAWSVAVADYPIAGTTPWQRPAGAPVIEWVNHDDRGWYEHALTGINPPYPHSLYFLDNQGNWYTPFIHPGMFTPYDLRGWHQ